MRANKVAAILITMLVLLFLVPSARGDSIVTIDASDIQIGQDVLNFSVELDATTAAVIPGTVLFGISNVQLPYYEILYGPGQPFMLFWFDNPDLASNMISFDGAGLPDTTPDDYP